LFSDRGKTLAAVLLLLAASAASASPTIISDSSVPIASTSTSDATAIVSCNLTISQLRELAEYFLNSPQVDNQITREPVPSQLIALAESFLMPTQEDNQATKAKENLCLPTLPPAVGMVLIGFMCVSLVRDRKTWVAVLAGLLWVGQTGIWALPQLSLRISRKVNNSQPIEPALADLYSLRDGFNPANYSEQKRYTGLLHYLEGIPQGTGDFTNNRTISLRHFSNAAGNGQCVSQYADTISQLVSSELLNCLVSGTRQFTCFTPAFIFNLIPRGPPMPA